MTTANIDAHPDPVTQDDIEKFGLFDDGAMDWDAAVAAAEPPDIDYLDDEN